MDVKDSYSNGVRDRKELAVEDLELAEKIDAGEYRARAYSQNWQAVDINWVVSRFAPGSKPEYDDGKIYYYNADRTIAVVADVGGGYLRILDFTNKTRRPYLDINGNDANNYVDERGKHHGRTRPQYQKATHFRILKRKEM